MRLPRPDRDVNDPEPRAGLHHADQDLQQRRAGRLLPLPGRLAGSGAGRRHERRQWNSHLPRSERRGRRLGHLPPSRQGRPPLPFGDADSSDLATQRSSTGDKIIQSGLLTIDGLRLAEIESLTSGTRDVPAWYFLQFSSAGVGGDLSALHTSLLGLDVACPASLWPTQRATLMAVLASMRFARPKG